jgi:hypothetical protein
MALDPAVLKARIDLRVYQLKQLAAWTAVNWRGRAEPEQPPRGLSPSPARRNELITILISHRLRVLGPEHGKLCIVLLNTQCEEVPMK